MEGMSRRIPWASIRALGGSAAWLLPAWLLTHKARHRDDEINSENDSPPIPPLSLSLSRIFPPRGILGLAAFVAPRGSAR